jgi:hypothetical protein
MAIPILTRSLGVDAAGDPIPHLREFESRGRTSHIHWDGCEVQRQFYVDDYRAAPEVCGALLGFVLWTGNGYQRYLPAFDPYYNQILYCNEARWDHVDGDKKSISNSPAIAGAPAEVPAEEAYLHFRDKVNTVREEAEGGAFITASYRPLISAYHGDRYGIFSESNPDRDRQFDFMDPQITAGSKTIPWPDGMVVRTDADILKWTAVSEEVADPVTIPTKDMTIRRMFLGEVPYAGYDAALGKVNNAAWPVGNPGTIQWPWTIPQFPAHTLRFDSYNVIRHWSQHSRANIWYEVELNFSAISLVEDGVHNSEGTYIGVAPVTWQHVFLDPGIRFRLGWFWCYRGGDFGVRPPTFRFHTYNFDNLFGT